MFCACLGILICFAIIITGSVISAVNIDRYDFGLYYVILAIVALSASFTLCVIRPAKFCGVRDPKWYTRACESVHQSLVAAHQRRLAEATTEIGVEPTTVAGTTRQRATLLMLGPAVQMMHHVIYGQVAETTCDEEEEVEEDGPSLWWDVAEYIEQDEGELEEEGKQKKRKKRKKKRKKEKEKEVQLDCIITSTADIAVHSSSAPIATVEMAQISSSANPAASPEKCQLWLILDESTLSAV